MANWDNQSTREEQARQAHEVDAGIVEGHAAMPDLLPDYVGLDSAAFHDGARDVEASRMYPLPAPLYKRVMDLTAREQGYVLGWLVRMDELTRGQG